jgi:hypothetical protein
MRADLLMVMIGNPLWAALLLIVEGGGGTGVQVTSIVHNMGLGEDLFTTGVDRKEREDKKNIHDMRRHG